MASNSRGRHDVAVTGLLRRALTTARQYGSLVAWHAPTGVAWFLKESDALDFLREIKKNSTKASLIPVRGSDGRFGVAVLGLKKGI